MAKCATLVLRSETAEESAKITEIANLDQCRAWSIDNEILRLELIEHALDRDDIDRARDYISKVNIDECKHDLTS